MFQYLAIFGSTILYVIGNYLQFKICKNFEQSCVNVPVDSVECGGKGGMWLLKGGHP